jgi:hypothetical protein
MCRFCCALLEWGVGEAFPKCNTVSFDSPRIPDWVKLNTGWLDWLHWPRIMLFSFMLHRTVPVSISGDIQKKIVKCVIRFWDPLMFSILHQPWEYCWQKNGYRLYIIIANKSFHSSGPYSGPQKKNGYKTRMFLNGYRALISSDSCRWCMNIFVATLLEFLALCLLSFPSVTSDDMNWPDSVSNINRTPK